MAISKTQPLGIYYEHPKWFNPLFEELERRGLPFDKIHAENHSFDPASDPGYSLLFNRMSPSAWQRGRANTIFYTLQYLQHLEHSGVRVINGAKAYRIEISKAAQLDLLAGLGLPYPRARVINHPSQAADAARGFRFPVVVKPNIGGSGAGVKKFDTPEALAQAKPEDLELGIDSTALVQEFIPPEESRITRVEVLGGKYLYGIRIYTPGTSFDLCPADVCQTTDGVQLDAKICALDAPSRGLRVEAYTPPAEIIEDVERIARASSMDVGGVEYMIDARDGRRYYYDINALSNFVADAPNVIGFNPFERLVDFIEEAA